MPRKHNNTPNAARPRLSTAALGGVALLIVSAVVLTLASATADISSQGTEAVRAEAVIGANDVALKALAQAVLLGEDRSLGVADDAAVDAAVAEAGVRLDLLETAAADLDSALGEASVVPVVTEVIQRARDALNNVTSGDVAQAASILGNEIRVGTEQVRDISVTIRDTSFDAVSSTGTLASRISFGARFLVALALPLILILAYRGAAQRQLRIAETKLEAQLEAEKGLLRAKDEFIASMSHELRTPLTSIYGFSELLLDTGLVDPDSAMDLIALINGESAELGRMVEDLLVSARAETGGLVYALEAVDLAREVGIVTDAIARDGRDIKLIGDNATMWADPIRVRQILRNLLSNAIRHGGESITVTGRPGKDRVKVIVADNGDGVPDDMRGRLYGRYVHDPSETLTIGSVGLGLSVVKSLAEGMGGGVDYERDGGWTRFSFWLPLTVSTSGVDSADAGGKPHDSDEVPVRAGIQSSSLPA